MPDFEPRRRRRVWRVAVALALGVGLLLWNVIFDLWLGQVERQFLFEQARHELHLARAVSLKPVMAHGIRDAVIVATGWTLVVVVSILGIAWYAMHDRRRD